MKKQLIACMVSLSFVFPTLAVQDLYAATSTSSTSTQLKKIQDAKNKAKSELTDTSKGAKEIEDKLKSLEKQIQEIDAELNDLNQKIQLEEKKMEESKIALQSQVRQMYESGEYSFLRQLLSSADFGNFFEKLDQTRFVLDVQNDQIHQYEASKKVLEKQRSEMKAKVDEQRPLLEEAQSKYQTLVKEQKQLETSLKKLEAAEAIEKERIAEKNRQVQQATQYYNGPSGSGQFGWPMRIHTVSSPFGPRNGRMHEGVDFSAPIGTPIYASDAGKVVLVKSDPYGYGNYVVIAHGNNMSSLYAHMTRSGIKVSVGQTVGKGQLIAYSGNEGRSSGPHLHFEIHKGSTPVDPMKYLPK